MTEFLRPPVFYRVHGRRRYCLVERYWVDAKVFPPRPLQSAKIQLSCDGYLTLQKGFCWDGPSGPAVDTPGTMGPSAAHDALYELINSKLLGKKHRKESDRAYRRLLRESGVPFWRRALHFRGVRLFGWLYT